MAYALDPKLYTNAEYSELNDPHPPTDDRKRPLRANGVARVEMSEMRQSTDGNDYDYLYTKPAIYEEIPHPRVPISHVKRPPPPEDNRRQQSVDSVISDSSIRKRHNPVYDEWVSRDSRHTSYKGDENVEDKSNLSTYLCLLTVAMFLFFLVASAGLGISVYLLIAEYDTKGKTVKPLTTHKPSVGSARQKPEKEKENMTISQLEDKFNSQLEELSARTNELLANMSQQIVTTNSALNRSVEELTSANRNMTDQCTDFREIVSAQIRNISERLRQEVREATDNVTAEWAEFRDYISTQVRNISRTPGPQGEEGKPAKFSSCKYVTERDRNPIVVEGSRSTEWFPNITVLTNHTVMGATCSVEFGKQHNIESREERITKSIQYRCQCSGKIGNYNRICILHLWICPL